MSKTVLEQRNVCLKCNKEKFDSYSYSAFFCNECHYKEDQFTIGEGLDFELFECLKCKKEFGRDGESYYGVDFVEDVNVCGECEKVCPILEIETQKEIVNCKICNVEYAKVKEDTYHYGNYTDYSNWCIECEKIQRKIDERKRYLENIKRLKALSESRKFVDVFPDEYVKIIHHTKEEYMGYDHKHDKPIYKIVTKKYYEFLCGYTLEITNYDLETAKEKHLQDDKCLPCKVLAGKSKANTMNQDHVATLFKKGVFGKHTKKINFSWSRSANYYSESNESRIKEGKLVKAGKLIHYSTTEGIRTFDGQVIENIQCWSAGWAKCSLSGADYHLPISTLETIYQDKDLLDLKVIQESESLQATLFKVKDDYLVYGNDLIDHSRYLVKIPTSAESVQQALDSLKPLLARNNVNVQRQGDIFFIPIDSQGILFPPKPEDLQVPDSYVATWYELERSLYPMREFLAKRFNIPYDDEKQSWYDIEKLVDAKLRTLKPHEIYQIELDYAKANKRKMLQKEHRNNQILDTNHIAEHLKVLNGVTYVKGKITHGREQHTKFVLDSWYIAKKNLAVQSWQVPERSGRGGGD